MATIKVKNTEGNWENVAIATQMKVEPIVLTDSQQYGCAGALGSAYLNLFGDTISTNNITDASYMFNNDKTVIKIPFDINFTAGRGSNAISMFGSCFLLEKAPKINNFRPGNLNDMFRNCQRLQDFPEDYFDNWDWSYLESLTSAFNGNCATIFNTCRSLRKLPLEIFNHMNPLATYYYTYFYSGFTSCYSVDEIVGLPIPYTAIYSSNMFGNTFGLCQRLKRLTFATQEDGSPKIVKWRNQTIDLRSNVGYGLNEATADDLNNSITREKIVKSDVTYQALKDDPDWFAYSPQWSRYNKTSAIETINSLPDTSAYLATTSGTNSIEFLGNSGRSTDGGAINTLTEAEIAVAAAKGWTVTFV